MRHSWVNIALLIFLGLLMLTGLLGLFSSSERFSWVMWLHSIGGYAVVALLLWKGRIIFDAFQKRRRSLAQPASISFLAMMMLLSFG